MRTIKTNWGMVKFDDSIQTKCEVFDQLIKYFKQHDVWSGESIEQKDGAILDAPLVLSEIADDIIQFQMRYKEGTEIRTIM